MEPVLAMALGAGETTPFKLTAAYAPFVNGGRRIEPHLIELVQDREGKTIFRADQRDCSHCNGAFVGDSESPHVAPPGRQVIDPITAYQMTNMLQGVVQRGTAAAVSSLGYPLAGKTGTTNEYRSAWFVGYSPDLIVGVFVGFDDNRSLGENETGAVDAVPVFIDFMGEVLKGQPKVDFKAPRNAKFGTVNGIREAFRPGTEPRFTTSPSSGGGGGQPSGPVPYQDLGKQLPPSTEPPKTPSKPKQPDLEGLY
jgi:penicillin-binding protein 1A